MAAIAFNTAQRAAERLETVLVAVGEKFDVFVGHGRAQQKGLNMPQLTHTGRRFGHTAFSSATEK